MDMLQALIVGVVEGVTEFLPISSTAHLIVASGLLGVAQSEFVKNFEIVIQLGSILAVAVVYWRVLFDWKLISKIVVAFIPTGIVGLALYKIVKTYLIGNLTVALWALGLGGVVLVAFEYWHGRRVNADHERVADLTYMQAFWVGVAQAVAIIPGVSRSGATILGGLAMGINRETVVQFSFMLAVPTMVAATGLDLLKSYKTFTGSNIEILAVGFIASFVVALISIKWLLSYVRRHDFKVFGIYRVIAALVFALLLLK